MKKLCLLVVVMQLLMILWGETNPVADYFNNPTTANYISAAQYCQKSLEKDPSQNNTKVLMANIAIMEASRLTEEVSLILDSLDTGGLFQYANLLLAQKDYAEAIKIYQKLNTDFPDWSCPWRHKGEALYRQENFKAAAIAFQQAITTNKEHYDAYLWLARAQYQLKKYKDALRNLETALALNPEAEESPDEVISADSIIALHTALLKKTGKQK